MKELITIILLILLAHVIVTMLIIHFKLVRSSNKTMELYKAVSSSNYMYTKVAKKSRFKKLKLLFGYKVYKWKKKFIRVPQNSLKPMSTIEVIGYIEENRTTEDEFLYELQGRSFLATKEK